MMKSIRVLIVGGGISGLTLANLLIRNTKKIKCHVIIFDSSPSDNRHKKSIGGGIGLWPPSQSVLSNIPNYSEFIDKYGFLMPFPSYRNALGKKLAQPNHGFSERFPVYSLNRDDLNSFLLDSLKDREDVDIIRSQNVETYERDKDEVIITTTDGNSHKGDLLIACDGIHSNIRNGLMRELQRPLVTETDLGYTYFRANTEIPLDSKHKWWSASFETWGEGITKHQEQHDIRFGYVPLKPPYVFWFIAIKTQVGHQHLSPIKGVQVVSSDTKAFLKDLIKKWPPICSDLGECVVNYDELITLTPNILRTDIAKIQGVEKFPWRSQDNRIVLMGDAAHATAPNIAQGAGLCIEDAACLVSKLDRVDYLNGLSEYEQERKPRAQQVQFIADLISTIGQAQQPVLKFVRNGSMLASKYIAPWLQGHVFEYVVSYSLGGSRKSMCWLAPRLSNTDDASSSLFANAFAEYRLLDTNIKEFKTSKIGGTGSGLVSIEKPSFVAKMLGLLAGLPRTMNKQPFYGEVVNLSKDTQQWTRVFGFNTAFQKTYRTTHSLFRGFDQQMYLSEGIGGVFDKAFRFLYKITLLSDNNDSNAEKAVGVTTRPFTLHYKSHGMTFFDLFKLPLPACLTPKSEWVEKSMENGWQFDGTISLPFVGRILHYHGDFQMNKPELEIDKRILIAGGSGMVGKEACLEFIKKGYDVYCLSRSLQTKINIDGVKVRLLNEDWSDLIDKNTIILNLSGSNPGAKRWSLKVKSDIAESRLRVIDIIIKNIERAREKPLKFLQASAVGFYGSAGDTFLTEDSLPVDGHAPGTKFRVTVCKQIEERANQADCPVINLRIGHVLSNEGGLLPYCKLAGYFNAARFGSGNQFVPFVHIKDVTKAMAFIVSNDKLMDGPINISAPEPCRNSEMLRQLSFIRSAPRLPIPETLLKFIIGQSFVVLMDSERVIPKRLLDNGFQFLYPNIRDSLQGLK
jgi:uncharacterized protein (TIGR01777 family)